MTTTDPAFASSIDTALDIAIDMAIDMAIGFGPGLLVSMIFFGGLALGIRAARTARRPTVLLIASAAIRIALLLGAALWVAGMGAGAAMGFAAAFIVARSVSIMIARQGAASGTDAG